MSHERLRTSHRSSTFARLETASKPSDGRESGAALEGFFIRSGILGTVGLMLIVWSKVYGYEQGVRTSSQAAIQESGQAAQVLVLPESDASGYSCSEILPSRPADKKYEGIYFFPGELDSNPPILTGVAHWYGGGENLNPHTATGEVFDPKDFTAASWFWNLGSHVSVTDAISGASVEVRINDRGPDRVSRPHRRDIIIDLAHGAFTALNPNFGVGRLDVEVQLVPCTQ